MSIEAIKQALDALEMYLALETHDEAHILEVDIAPKAINALRAAISQADEPVLWYHSVSSRVRFDGAGLGRGWVPLYTAPRQWVELTDDEARGLVNRATFGDKTNWQALVYMVDAKLKEKNA